MALLAWRRHWLRLAAFALAVLTSELLIGPVKAAYGRDRPPGSLIETSAAAFPSGHAIAGAVTAVGLVLVLAPPGPSRWRWEVRAVAFRRPHGALARLPAGALAQRHRHRGPARRGLALGWPALLMALRSRIGAQAPPAP
jgi:undecaprenyl-diphosphatase